MVESQRKRTVMVVDDEPRIIEAVSMNLELEGCQVTSASSGYEALKKISKELPDLVILDVMMPEMDGFETLRRIREISTVPVIMLTVRGEETDKIRGLDLGADDYVTKPFSPRELVSRVKALLRRAETPTAAPKTEIQVDDDLSIDFNRRKVMIRGKEIKLRPTEYRLLYHLVSNAGSVLPHETLLRRVWGYEYRDEDHYLWLYITYLRQKIEEDPKHPRYILGERGIGYRFKEFEKH
ncbi:MAG: response regulator transcription factor [Dehalococcoidia bacterium]